MATLESMAAAEVLNRGPKSRAYYRIQATRKLTGGGNLIKRKTAAADRRESLADGISTGPDEDVIRVFFDPGQYTVFENVGTFALTVVRQVEL
jgi:solute carrier family 8 (sodium/calcium exchanger)